MEEMRIENLDSKIELELENITDEINKRKKFINKFLEKFPKANLRTLSQINKYYNGNVIDKISLNKCVLDYLTFIN